MSALASLSFVFLFPSTGKAFLNDGIRSRYNGFAEVSIPFHREGVSEPEKFQVYLSNAAIKFLFPSTGKAFLNFSDSYVNTIRRKKVG